jgi:hypothetical protein
MSRKRTQRAQRLEDSGASCASSRLNLLGRLIIAAVFGVAGALKIVDPIGFARSIVDYDLIPELIVPVIAVVLPWWEVGAATLAIVGRWRAGALAVLLGMSATFLTLGIITFARGLSPECGCFGLLSERVGPLSISIQAGLVTISALLVRTEIRGLKPRQVCGRKEAQVPQEGRGRVAVASAAST